MANEKEYRGGWRHFIFCRPVIRRDVFVRKLSLSGVKIYVSFNLPSLLDPSLYILNFVVKINLDKSYDLLCNTFRYPNLQVIIHSFPSNARPPSEFPNKILTEVCM